MRRNTLPPSCDVERSSTTALRRGDVLRPSPWTTSLLSMLATAWCTLALLVAATPSAHADPDAQNADAQRSDATPSPTSSQPAWRVGVLYWSETIEGQVVMRQGLEAKAQALNAQGGRQLQLIAKVAGDGPDGQQKQVRQMNALIDDKVDAIIVQPTDNAVLTDALRRANAAGIPVVAYDQYILGGDLASYITSDNRQAGQLDGEYIASLFADTHEVRLVLIEYPHVSSTVERLDGFLHALEAQGQKYKILKSYKAVEPVAGKQAGQAILRDFPKRGSIDVVFSVNDGGGLAVVEELAAAGRDEIRVATIDGDPTSVDNIRKRRLTVIDSAQFCGALGAEAMRATHKLLLGGTVPKQMLIPTFPITSETLERYPGWAAPLPSAFTKPWPSTSPRWTPQPQVSFAVHPDTP